MNKLAACALPLRASPSRISFCRSFFESPTQRCNHTWLAYRQMHRASRAPQAALGTSGQRIATLAALAAGLSAFVLLQGSIHTETAKSNQIVKSSPPFTKEQVSLLCMIGVPGSGKSEHAKRLQERWPDFEIVHVDSTRELIAKVTKAKAEKPSGMKSYIVDGLPRNMQEVAEIEEQLVPVFCCLFHDLPEVNTKERFGENSREYKAWKTASQDLEPVVKRYRLEGNICEISADWPSADEVWEQVEAKTEQILELRERGDL